MSKKRYDYNYQDISDLAGKETRQLASNSQPDSDFEVRDTVISALKQLKPYLKEIIILKHYHQLKFKEISEITNTPVGTLKARFHRAIAQMKGFLDQVDIS